MTYASHIAEATLAFMAEHPKALLMGAGVTDIKHCYGTTALAHETFPDRVLETPLSEQMLTGACVGLAENGFIPIFVHQRADFATLSVEHLVNTAAKHKYLFGDVPMMVRMVIGQGWGNGPNHTASFAHWFANVPGLDVHVPVTRWAIDDAFESLEDGNTVVLVEHRRLYETDLTFKYAWPPNRLSVNLFPVSASAIDAQRAAFFLGHDYQVTANVWPVQRLTDLELPGPDWVGGRPAIVVDCGPQAYGPSAEIAARLYDSGASKVIRISPPAHPCPASAPLEAAWYPTASDIVNAALEALGSKERMDAVQVNHVPAGQGAF